MLTIPSFKDGNVVQAVNDMIAIGNTYSAMQGNTSLIEVSNPARIRPLCVVGEDCMYLDYLTDLLQTNLNIFTGYWLQAFNIQAHARVGNVEVLRTLDRLSPTRDPLQSLGYSRERMMVDIKENHFGALACEAASYRHGLPLKSNHLAMEAAGELIDASVGDREFMALSESNNLGVGKDIQVVIDVDGGGKLKFMVNVSLAVAPLASNLITMIFGKNAEDYTILERYYAMKSGRKSLGDLIFGFDIIREHRKMLIQDKSGVYSEIVSRANKNKVAGVVSGDPSVATASNVYIMSYENAKEIESKMHGQFKDARFRDNLFQDTYAMMLCIVHKDAERITFYHRSIAQPTTLSVGALKNASKNKGPDVGEILKAYTLSTAPTF